MGEFGNYVVVEHDVYGVMFYSVYAHLDTQTVSVGQVVDNNIQVGTMGNTKPGCTNCAVHLHFEIRKELSINLSKPIPFVIYWPKTMEEFHQNFVDLSPLMK